MTVFIETQNILYKTIPTLFIIVVIPKRHFVKQIYMSAMSTSIKLLFCPCGLYFLRPFFFWYWYTSRGHFYLHYRHCHVLIVILNHGFCVENQIRLTRKRALFFRKVIIMKTNIDLNVLRDKLELICIKNICLEMSRLWLYILNFVRCCLGI